MRLQDSFNEDPQQYAQLLA